VTPIDFPSIIIGSASHPGASFHGFRLIGGWQDDAEFLSADAANQIPRAKRRDRSPCDFGDHCVAGGMPIGVVDRLEPIDVENGIRQFLAPVGRSGDRAVQGVHETATIAEAGHLVARCGALQHAARFGLGSERAADENCCPGGQAEQENADQGQSILIAFVRDRLGPSVFRLNGKKILLDGFDPAQFLEDLVRSGPAGPRADPRQRSSVVARAFEFDDFFEDRT
jgi:hypothetical protein